MKFYLVVLLLSFAFPAVGARRLLSTPFYAYLRHVGDGNYFSNRFRVDIVNISSLSQSVVVKIRDIQLEQSIATKTEAEGDTHYFNWTKHPVNKRTRFRSIRWPDLERTVAVAGDSTIQLTFYVSCKVDNGNIGSDKVAPPSTCSDAPSFTSGHAAPFELIQMDGTTVARFEIATTGANADRGALLTSFGYVQTVGGTTQDLTREMNGGRPF